MQWDYPEPHLLQKTVQVEDMDGLNHTNNAVYVKWCEQVAWSHSVALGLDLKRYEELDRAMVIARSEFDYLAASRVGDEIVAATWIVDWDRKLTMHREFQVVRVQDQVTLLRGRMRFACVELSSGRPRRLPEAFISGYGPVILSEQALREGSTSD